MNKDEVLILKPQFPVKPEDAYNVREMVFKQMEEGIVLLPFGYEVIVKPKQIDIKIGTDKDEDKVIHNAATYIILADKNNRGPSAERICRLLYDRAYRKGFEAGKLEGCVKTVEKVVYTNDKYDGDRMGG
jgi:hypothetical protein